MKVEDIIILVIGVLILILDILADAVFTTSKIRKPIKIIEAILCIIGFILIIVTV